MENKKSIDVLNELIVINNDRIEGYETALKETAETDLKILFSKFIQTSQQCRHDLVMEVTRLGGTPDEGTRTTGKFFRVWMDVKAALTGKDRKAILDSCEYGEDVAQETYEKVIENDGEDISYDQVNMLEAQQQLLKADHDKVKAMRDMAKANA